MSRKKKTILVLEEDHRTLKRVAFEQGRSMLSVVQEAISLLDERYKLQLQDTFSKDRNNWDGKAQVCQRCNRLLMKIQSDKRRHKKEKL